MSPRFVDTTITYLSMSQRPAHVPPMPMKPRLALMWAEDVPLGFYRYLFDAVGSEWLWIERRGLDDDRLARHVHKEGVAVFVLYANGSPAGYYELDFSNPERTNLSYFGLMSRWIGYKIGPWMLGSAVSEAFSRGAGEVTVNTCTCDHPAALPLYQKLGFRPVRREERRVRVPADMTIPGHIAARMSR